MDINEKLRILSGAAKYDVSCSSSGSNRSSKKGAIGSVSSSGICHSFTPDGRCISLLKILLSNCCIYDCAYDYSCERVGKQFRQKGKSDKSQCRKSLRPDNAFPNRFCRRNVRTAHL